MADLWDKLIKQNLVEADPTISINGFASVVLLIAKEQFTVAQASDIIIDSFGDPLSDVPADVAQLQLLIDEIIANEGGGPAFEREEARVAQAVTDLMYLNLAELGWVNRAGTLTNLGV